MSNFSEIFSKNVADRKTEGRAISPNRGTMTFGTPCIIKIYENMAVLEISQQE